jgi:hypothetical protein
MKLPVLLILLLSISLIGCDTRQSLQLVIAGERNQTVDLRLDPDQPGRYLLRDKVVVNRTNRAFYLRYRGGGTGTEVRILGRDGRQITTKNLPPAEDAVVYLPLKRGQIVQGFWIEAVNSTDPLADSAIPASPPAGRPELLEAGITDEVSGFDNSGRVLTMGTTVQRLYRNGRATRLTIGEQEGWPLRRPDGSSLQVGTQPASVLSNASGWTGWQIAVVLHTAPPYDYADFRSHESLAYLEGESNLIDPEAEPEPRPASRRTSILLRLQSGDRTASIRHSALAGQHTLYLYHGMVPFIPETFSIEPMGGAAVWLESFEIARLAADAAVSPVAAGRTEDTVAVQRAPGESGDGETSPVTLDPAALHPLPADPGALLLYDPESWRQPDYELFAWSRFPRILIMDTRSYAVQSRFFKRLAFFVEKRGYRGRLVSNEEFVDLHGFNAHDYRAEDLARFFQQVREELFPLNPEEELLKEILLTNGIIRDDGIFSPGRGGILSISRSSYPMLRRHLLTHECAHGMFFSLPEFREASFQAWDRLSDQEQEFWKLFFRWVGYDTEDPYLTVNEYQAYLFQQPRSGVRYYFTDLTASRLISSYPGQAPWVQELIRSDPERFTRAFDDLENSLVRIAGLEGGRVIELESAELK